MNKEEIYLTWAPDSSLWSRWAKPVLFAYLESESSPIPAWENVIDASWAPSPEEKVILVLDLPGAEGVLMSIALATKGYRPVPLYNAVPLPTREPLIGLPIGLPIVAVDVLPIIAALKEKSEHLAQLSLANDAPPAFLLDANRHGDGPEMRPGEFDNRSISFTTDFPSANFFAAHGFKRVLLAQRNNITPQPDLAHSLRRWQEAGFVLERFQLDVSQRPEPFEIARPSWYGAMFQRALSSIGLRRSRAGGFGAWMQNSSAGG
jgi:hypothetical protein